MDATTGTARSSCPTTSCRWPSARRARTPGSPRGLTEVPDRHPERDAGRGRRAPRPRAGRDRPERGGSGGAGRALEALAESAPEEVVEAAEAVVSEAGRRRTSPRSRPRPSSQPRRRHRPPPMERRSPIGEISRPGPERTCIGCRRAGASRRLVRLVRSPDGVVRVDRTGAGARAYVHATVECMGRAGRGRRDRPGAADRRRRVRGR